MFWVILILTKEKLLILDAQKLLSKHPSPSPTSPAQCQGTGWFCHNPDSHTEPQRGTVHALSFKQESFSRHLFCAYYEVEHHSRHQVCKNTGQALRGPIYFPQEVRPPAL